MRVLCLFDYVARTGFGTVSKNIVREITKHYGDNIHLDIVAVNYFGEPFWEKKNVYVIPAKKNDVSQDDFGRFLFLKILKESNDYDGIFICQDLGVVVPFIEVMEHIKREKRENNRKSFKSIFYFPLDCEMIPELARGLEFFDVLVTYTEFARNEIYKYRKDLKIGVIPHGNNPKDFYPLSDTDSYIFRVEYFGENANKFIITNVNRNQPRKDIPNTIFGFMEARSTWLPSLPKPFLYLHTHPQDPMGWDIRAIFKQTDLVEDVDYKLLPKEYEEQMVDVPTLNKIYNASDVFLTTALGEGWGLSFSEAAAAKVPIVAPYSTSFIEMSGYGKNAYMLYNLYPFCSPNDNVIRKQTDIFEIGDSLHQVARDKYENNPELQQKVERAYQWVSKLSWSEVCKRWIEHFKIYL